MNTLDARNNKPWYRQFWPWFLITLPGCVIVAALITVYIAYKGADHVISDSYYRDGLAINQVLEQDRMAAELSMAATLRFDLESGEVFVTLIGSEADQGISLAMLHPFDKDQDDRILLKPVRQGNYRADLSFKPINRYYLRLEPEPLRNWRLSGEIDFDKAHELRLESHE